jgi:hypothetical protein
MIVVVVQLAVILVLVMLASTEMFHIIIATDVSPKLV